MKFFPSIEARKKQRQQAQDFTEELSDEEVDLVKNLDKELGDEAEDDMIPDLDDPKSRTGTPTYVVIFVFRHFGILF